MPTVSSTMASTRRSSVARRRAPPRRARAPAARGQRGAQVASRRPARAARGEGGRGSARPGRPDRSRRPQLAPSSSRHGRVRPPVRIPAARPRAPPTTTGTPTVRSIPRSDISPPRDQRLTTTPTDPPGTPAAIEPRRGARGRSRRRPGRRHHQQRAVGARPRPPGVMLAGGHAQVGRRSAPPPPCSRARAPGARSGDDDLGRARVGRSATSRIPSGWVQTSDRSASALSPSPAAARSARILGAAAQPLGGVVEADPDRSTSRPRPARASARPIAVAPQPPFAPQTATTRPACARDSLREAGAGGAADRPRQLVRHRAAAPSTPRAPTASAAGRCRCPRSRGRRRSRARPHTCDRAGAGQPIAVCPGSATQATIHRRPGAARRSRQRAPARRRRLDAGPIDTASDARGSQHGSPPTTRQRRSALTSRSAPPVAARRPTRRRSAPAPSRAGRAASRPIGSVDRPRATTTRRPGPAWTRASRPGGVR